MRNCSFITAMLSGALAAMSLAMAMVKDSSSSFGTTLLIIPRRSARSADIGLAVKAISCTMRSGAALRKVTMPLRL